MSIPEQSPSPSFVCSDTRSSVCSSALHPVCHLLSFPPLMKRRLDRGRRWGFVCDILFRFAPKDFILRHPDFFHILKFPRTFGKHSIVNPATLLLRKPLRNAFRTPSTSPFCEMRMLTLWPSVLYSRRSWSLVEFLPHLSFTLFPAFHERSNSTDLLFYPLPLFLYPGILLEGWCFVPLEGWSLASLLVYSMFLPGENCCT